MLTFRMKHETISAYGNSALCAGNSTSKGHEASVCQERGKMTITNGWTYNTKN